MGEGQPRDPLAILVDRMDVIIDLLRVQVGMRPKYVAELQTVRSPALLQQDQNLLMELMLAATIPSAPESTEEFTVGILEVELARNESLPLMRVEVTNDNVAMPLWVSAKRGVLVTTGRVILAQVTTPFVIAQGHSLWGICPLPNASIRVSRAFDFYNILDGMRNRAREG